MGNNRKYMRMNSRRRGRNNIIISALKSPEILSVCLHRRRPVSPIALRGGQVISTKTATAAAAEHSPPYQIDRETATAAAAEAQPRDSCCTTILFSYCGYAQKFIKLVGSGRRRRRWTVR